MGFFKALRSHRAPRMLMVGLAAALLMGQPARALPEGATVIHGGATVNGSGQNMTIQQTTQQAIINWNGFSINTGEMVRFLQPSQLSAVLNRVTGVDPSVINGILQGNGNIFLINPNGVLIGPGGMVNAGGFMASTLELSDADFLSGNMHFKQTPGHDLAAVINQGQIKVTDGGFVVLLGPSVANEGLILAKGGEVSLGAGKEATVNFDGRNLIHFALANGPTGAADGTMVMSQASASNVLAQVVNNLGIEEAGSLSMGGEIVASDIRMQGVNAEILPDATVRGGDLTLDFTGSVEMGSQFYLDGGDIVVTAGSNITFDTLVAERVGNDGGLVSLTAGGNIVANTGGSGIAADRVELTSTQGSISTPVSANSLLANAPNGDVSLSIQPGIIDGHSTGSDTSSTGGNVGTGTSGTTTGTSGTGTAGSTGTVGSTSTSTGSGSSSSSGSTSSSTVGSRSSGSRSLIGIPAGGSGSEGSTSSSSSSSNSRGIVGIPTSSHSSSSSPTAGGTTPTGTGGADGGSTILPQTEPVQPGTPVGVNGTTVRVNAGGNVVIDSVNTLYVEQISGNNVSVRSQTGSIVDAGDSVQADNRDIIASNNVTLSAADFLGTIDNPLEVDIGGDLDVFAGNQVDGISGVLTGPVFGQFNQEQATAGIVLLNPGNGLQDGIAQANRGVMDNTLPGDDSTLGGASVANLFLLRLVNSIDEEEWLAILRGTVVWEDDAVEATEGDL